MTISTVTLTPSAHALGVGAVAEATPASWELLARVADPGYYRWLAHVMPAAACAQPIRLRVEAQWRDDQGRVVEVDHISDDMPDRALYVACKNRRSSVCPGCSQTYRADMYQLIKAGLHGGKGVPASVVRHPCWFVTLTAPSFGELHTAHTTHAGVPKPCRPRRNPQRCPHGVLLACHLVHGPEDARVGEPFCKDCYDYAHQAVWNLHAGELWRRTTITLNRRLTTAAKALGVSVRLQYAKVAEYQHRGVIHYHALIRLDGFDPHHRDTILTPDPAMTAAKVETYLAEAVTTTSLHTAPHPTRPAGWPITWGVQLDIRTVRLSGSDMDDAGQLTSTAVAGYLAKYATKATEVAGYTSHRLTAQAIRLLGDRDTHQTRQVQACWYLGQRPAFMASKLDRRVWNETWGKLQRWAHMLGFGGHFATKSRRYSTTLTALREVRAAYQRGQQPPSPEHQPRDEDQASIEAAVTVAHTFDGLGWLTMADAQLANTAAAKARDHRLTARHETETALAERRWI